MYSERRLVKFIENSLGYAIGNLKAAKKMLREKRPAYDVFCQLNSGKANLDENVFKNFSEVNRVDLNIRINRLLQKENLDEASAETLAGIQKQLGSAPVKKLFAFEKIIQKIEGLFFWFLLWQTDFFELLLQNPLWPDL